MFDDILNIKTDSTKGWYNQVSIENAINKNGKIPSTESIFFIQAPSSLMVDKYGKRYLNERNDYHKEVYHIRSRRVYNFLYI